MKVGIPREVKNREYPVAITPAGVQELVRHGHEVVVEAGAGAGSSLPNEDYLAPEPKSCRVQRRSGRTPNWC